MGLIASCRPCDLPCLHGMHEGKCFGWDNGFVHLFLAHCAMAADLMLVTNITHTSWPQRHLLTSVRAWTAGQSGTLLGIAGTLARCCRAASQPIAGTKEAGGVNGEGCAPRGDWHFSDSWSSQVRSACLSQLSAARTPTTWVQAFVQQQQAGFLRFAMAGAVFELHTR